MSGPRLSILQSRAVSDDRVSDAQFRTLAALGCYGDEDGWCFPSLKKLKERLHKSPQAISKDISALVQHGYLEKHPRFGKDGSRRSNLYRLKFDLPPSTPEVDRVSTPEIDTPSTPEVEVNDPINASDNGINKSGKPAPVKAQDFPSNVLYRELTGRWPAKPIWHKVLHCVSMIEKRLGRAPVREDVQPFLEEWCERGHSPTSLKWLTEWAVSGVIPGRNQQPKPRFDVGAAIRNMMQEEPEYVNA